MKVNAAACWCLEIGRLGVDEEICPDAVTQHSERADSALQLTDDKAQNDVAFEFYARVDQCLDRAEIGGIACLHI